MGYESPWRIPLYNVVALLMLEDNNTNMLRRYSSEMIIICKHLNFLESQQYK